MNGFAARRLESKSIDHTIMSANESTLRESLVETTKRNKAAAADVSVTRAGTPHNLPEFVGGVVGVGGGQKRRVGSKMTEVHQSLQ